MELRHLRYFVVVAEEGHFTRAAERLGIQQPPLSQQIRALERELGFDLFRRHPKGADLTPAGRAFLEEARAILDKVQQAAVRAGRVANGSAGTIALGFTSSAAAHPFIPQVVRAFREAWPDVSLDFKGGNASEVMEAIAAGKLHLGFLRGPVSGPPGLIFEPLLDEEVLLALPRGHPLLAGRRGDDMPVLPLTSLKDEQFILVRRTGAPGVYSLLTEACRRAGFTPRIVVEVDRMLTNISLVAAGLGVSPVPASMRGFHEDSVVYCRISDAGAVLSTPLTLVRRDEQPIPAARHFLDMTAQLLQQALAALREQ